MTFNNFFFNNLLPGQNDVEMGPANLLHALVYYSEYNERFDLVTCLWMWFASKFC